MATRSWPCKKKQNARRSLTKSVHKIYAAGMFVIAGFIVGFDTEKGSIADGMVDCIEEADIAICMAGLLTALANTQLTARLTREGRMFPATWQIQQANEGGRDQCTLGLNFETLRPRRDVLADYKSVIDRVYTPEAYFGRVTRAARRLDCFWPSRESNTKPAWRIAGFAAADCAALFRLLRSVIIEQPLLLGYYIKALYVCARENPGALNAVGIMATFYLHLGPFSRVVSQAITRQIDEIDSGRWQSPAASIEAEMTGEDFLKRYKGETLESQLGHSLHV